MGGFGPLAALSRDDDCFSVWYMWGVSTIELSDFFSKKFNSDSTADWTKLSVKLVLYVLESYAVCEYCMAELEHNKLYPWTQNFDFITKGITLPSTHPKVLAADTGIVNDIVLVVKMLLGILTTYLNSKHKFYFWGTGYAFGGLLSHFFVAINKWFNLQLIDPMPAYERYLDDWDR